MGCHYSGKFLLLFYSDINKTNSEVNISHETTTMVIWIYDGI